MPELHTNFDHPDPTGGRLFPLTTITPDALSLVPIGSEMVIIQGVGQFTVEDGDWSESEAKRLMQVASQLTEEDQENIFIFYLPPLVSPQYALSQSVRRWAGSTGELYHLVKTGQLTADEFTAILMDVAREAQKEVIAS